jgi:hypothetical protein
MAQGLLQEKVVEVNGRRAKVELRKGRERKGDPLVCCDLIKANFI